MPLLNENETLKKVPENTSPPRILLLYTIDKLPAVPEVTEVSSNSEIQPHLSFDEIFAVLSDKNRILREKITELEDVIQNKR